MKTTNQFLFILFLCLFFGNNSFGQDNLQNIYQPVFTNPSYNSFNDCYSANLIVRNQWGSKVVGSPEVYGLNLFMPAEGSLGIGLKAIQEDQGLSSRFTILGLLSHYVKISNVGYLGFGYGIGIDCNSYDLAEIYEYNPDIIVSGDEFDNSVNGKVTVGISYNRPNFYTGLSFCSTLNSEYSKYKVARDFDWSAAYFWEVNKDFIIKPELAIKYYRIRESVYTNSDLNEDWIDPIFNLGVNALLFNRVWLGVYQRFDYAQTYNVSFYVTNSLKLGYIFERGIGNGVNQFDSHMFGISWSYPKSKSKKNSKHNLNRNGAGHGQFVPVVNDLIYW